MGKVVHAILPAVVIAAMTALCIAGKLSATAALAVIVSAGSIGGVAVASGSQTAGK